MKSYEELIIETLNQRAIIDNRQVVSINDVTPSVLIAFDRACSEMRDMYNWVWNKKKLSYVTQAGRTSYPMPYGIMRGMYLTDDEENVCTLDYADELTAKEGCPTQWSYDWENEEITIAPAEKDNLHTMTIEFFDKHIAYHTDRSNPDNLMKTFDKTGGEAATTNQFLNVPEVIYEAYSKCVVTLTRVYLNEGAQPTVFEAQKQEFQNALNSLLEYAKTPFYKAQRFEL